MANKHGGYRPGSGRKPGETTAAKRDLMAMAMDLGEDALAALKEIANDRSAPPAARVSAATAILDRGFGKPSQALNIGGQGNNPLVTRIVIEAAAHDDGDDPAPA